MDNKIKKYCNLSILFLFSIFILPILSYSYAYSASPIIQDVTVQSYKEAYADYYGKIQIGTLMKDVEEWEMLCNNSQKTSHESLEKYLTMDVVETGRTHADIVLAIDNSKSMVGYKMDNAKTAAIDLISITDDNDRISIFTFSNDSVLINDFSHDKEILKSSIYSIGIGEATFYSPSLENILSYMEEEENPNYKSIIFVSDGAPKDNESDIYETVEKITQHDICIITIGYGEELKDSGVGENILQNIATISKRNTGCGSYLYSPTEIDSFMDILKKAYDESRQDNAKIKIIASIENKNITSDDELRISAKIRSEKNNLKVPGEAYDVDQSIVCAERMLMFFVLEDINDDKNRLVFSFSFNRKDDEYQLYLNSIPEGTYNSYMIAIEEEISKNISSFWIDDIKWIYSIKDLKSTKIQNDRIGSILDFGEITVDEKKRGFCENSNCITLQEYIFSRTEVKDISITRYGFVPDKITISDGTTIRWTNNDNKAHSIIITESNISEAFPPKTLEPKETYSIYFPKAGRIRYYDNISDISGDMDKDDLKIISVNDFVIQYKNTLNFIILIDRSGSMFDGKLDEIKRATNNLFDKMYYDDRVAVISFSDDARVVHEFTNNMTSLKNSVDKIVPDGSTLYIDGFDEVDAMFDRNNIESGKVVLLLTDGMPWDDGKPNSIYKRTEKLVDDGICVYAVGYGIPDGEEEAHKILTNIVKISKESTNCGNYSYVESDEKELKKVFGDIYYKEIGDLPTLSIVSNMNNEIDKNKETLNVQIEIKSRINNRKIPGVVVIGNTTICSAPAIVNYTIIKNNKRKMSGNIEYLGQGHDYYKEIDIKKLRNGEYRFIVSARAMCEEGYSSNFIGTSENIITIKDDGESDKYIIFVVIGIVLLLMFLVGLLLIRNRRYS